MPGALALNFTRYAIPPSVSSTKPLQYGWRGKWDRAKRTQYLTKFIISHQGLSSRTLEGYNNCLIPFISKYPLTTEGIRAYLAALTCGNGKSNYYRVIKTFCNWLYKEGLIKENPILRVDPPTRIKYILPSLSPEQFDLLLSQVNKLRDRAILCLLIDSGLRLTEIAGVKPSDIDFNDKTIHIFGKGNKEGLVPFTERTAILLRTLIAENPSTNLWKGANRRGIQIMLNRLAHKTGLPCNAHTFRRTFACNLYRAGFGLDDIMRLGRWDNIEMVIHYTRSIKSSESLKKYREADK